MQQPQKVDAVLLVWKGALYVASIRVADVQFVAIERR